MGQRSVVEVDRLLVAVPMAPSSCRIETMTPHEYASHSPAIAAPLLACITAHSTCITPRHHHFRRRATENAARTGQLNQFRFRSGSGQHEGII